MQSLNRACPLSILKLLTPTEDEYAVKWREKCRKYHAQTAAFKKLPIGTKVKWITPAGFRYFKDGEIATLEKVSPKGNGDCWLCRAVPVYIKPKHVDMDVRNRKRTKR